MINIGRGRVGGKILERLIIKGLLTIMAEMECLIKKVYVKLNRNLLFNTTRSKYVG